MVGGIIFGTIKQCRKDPREEAIRLSQCKFSVPNNFAHFISVRQRNINRLAGSQISNDSEVDTNGKIYS